MTNPTSVSEIIALTAMVFTITFLMVWLRSTSKLICRDVKRLRGRKSATLNLNSLSDETIASGFRSYYRSLVGVAVSLLAPLVFVAGITACSKLRDLGYTIFWTPILIAYGIAGLAGWFSIRLHDQIVLGRLASTSQPQ